jgi:hypothetical protein
MASPVAAAESPTSSAATPKLTDFVAPDFCAAIVMHPSQIAKSPVGQALGMGQTQAMPGAPAGGGLETAFLQKVKPEKIRRTVLLIDPVSSGVSPVSQGIIVQLEEDVDLRKLLTEAIPETETITVEGKSCLKCGRAGPGVVPMVAYIPNGRMVLLAPEPTLKKMLASNSGPRPLLDLLRKADMKSDIVVELLAQPLAKASSPPSGAASAPGMGPAAGMLAEIKTVSATVTLNGPILVHATFYGVKPDSTDKIHGMLSFFQAMIANQVKSAKSPPPQGTPPATAAPMAAMGELFQGLSITKQPDRVELTLKTPKNFPELAKQLAESAKAMGPMGMPGAAPATPPPGPPATTGK